MNFKKPMIISAILLCMATFCLPIKASAATYNSDQLEINRYVREICKEYDNVDPELIIPIVSIESRYNPDAKNGSCVGLMQVSTKYNKDRADKLGVSDFFDPYGNIQIGVDYISELIEEYDDVYLALMLYNMKWDSAFKLYNSGSISNYAKSVVKHRDELYEMTSEELYGEEVIFYGKKDVLYAK